MQLCGHTTSTGVVPASVKYDLLEDAHSGEGKALVLKTRPKVAEAQHHWVWIDAISTHRSPISSTPNPHRCKHLTAQASRGLIIGTSRSDHDRGHLHCAARGTYAATLRLYILLSAPHFLVYFLVYHPPHKTLGSLSVFASASGSLSQEPLRPSLH